MNFTAEEFFSSFFPGAAVLLLTLFYEQDLSFLLPIGETVYFMPGRANLYRCMKMVTELG